jgi:hypothetical protein
MPVMPDATVFTAGAYDQAHEKRQISPYLCVHPDGKMMAYGLGTFWVDCGIRVTVFPIDSYRLHYEILLETLQ